MKLNDIGEMINKWLIKIPEHFPGTLLDIYQIMPNHIHIIIVIVGAGSSRPNNVAGSSRPNNVAGSSRPTLGQIIGYFKYQTTKQINARFQTGAMYGRGIPARFQTGAMYGRGIPARFQTGAETAPLQEFKKIWQRNYYEHVIRNENELYKIQEYIQLNPEMWDKDRNNPIWTDPR